jgi:hypothetical protein
MVETLRQVSAYSDSPVLHVTMLMRSVHVEKTTKNGSQDESVGTKSA